MEAEFSVVEWRNKIQYFSMQKKQEKIITTYLVKALSNRNNVVKHELINAASKELKYSAQEIDQVISFMIDRKEIARHETSPDFIRLANSGKEAHKPLRERMIDYLLVNWIAISGVIISIAGLIISIIALHKSSNLN